VILLSPYVNQEMDLAMARPKGEEKIDTHIYVTASLLKRLNRVIENMRPRPSRNAAVEDAIEAWTERREPNDQR